MIPHRHWLGAFTTGASVAALYLVFLSVMFGGFAGYVSRINLGKGLAPEIGTLDTLIFRGTRESNVKQRLDLASESLSTARAGLQDVEFKLAELEGEAYLLQSRQLEVFLPVSTLIIVHREILDGDFMSSFQEINEQGGLRDMEKVDRLNMILTQARFNGDASPEAREEFTRTVTTTLADLHEGKSQITKLEVRSLKLRQERDWYSNRLNDLVNKITALESELSRTAGVLEDKHRALIASFENSLWGIPYYLIQIPTIILTLLVTIAAGGLGSVVSFTRKFLRGYSGTGAPRLFVNVGEGVAASVAIFFLAGAGMLMLTQSMAKAEDSVELSPYMVAFIAFVSGFMAEDAFSRIQLAGRNLFQSKNGQDIDFTTNEDPENSHPSVATAKAADDQSVPAPPSTG